MSTIKTWVERLPDGVRFCPSTTEMIPAMREEIAELRAALAASGGNAAPIDPTVQGMADCMHMVQQELIEADAIPGGTAPMFIANEVVRKLNSYKRENLELKRVYEERGEQIKRLDIALDRAASAPNAALVAALQNLLHLADEFGIQSGVCCCGDDMKRHGNLMDCGHSPVDSGEYYTASAIEEARKALSAAGQEVGHG